MRDELAWVVEFPMNEHGVRYWGRTISGLGITNENADALRFSRKQDAEDLIIYHEPEWKDAVAVEHMWCGDRPTFEAELASKEQQLMESERLREIAVTMHNDLEFNRVDLESALAEAKERIYSLEEAMRCLIDILSVIPVQHMIPQDKVATAKALLTSSSMPKPAVQSVDIHVGGSSECDKCGRLILSGSYHTCKPVQPEAAKEQQ